MRWEELLNRFAGQPLFHTSHLGIFPDPSRNILVQLSRWVKAGKLVQIRRGWYLIDKPYRTKEISEAAIANAVVHPSYLSLEWALQFHGMIPEAAFHPTSITTRRGIQFESLGHIFLYHHVSPVLFRGYTEAVLAGEKIIVAGPEKALLDHVYLFSLRRSFSTLWLESLRLQNLDRFDLEEFGRLGAFVRKAGFAAVVDVTIKFIKEINSKP